MFLKSWKFNLDKLVTQKCLLFGNTSKSTSKKVAQYLLGTRETLEVFKLYELRYLLLKTYPLIHNLFHNPRVNVKPKSQKVKNLKKNFNSLTQSLHNQWHMRAKTSNFKRPDNHHRHRGRKEMTLQSTKVKTRPGTKQIAAPKAPWKKKQIFSKLRQGFVWKTKNKPPQILFASITPMYAKILSQAAQICNMPWHENRWLSGSITAAISYPRDKLLWQYLQDDVQEKIFYHVWKKWGGNKENKEKIKEKIKYYGRSRWPSLMIIPDISNNSMVLKEAQKVGLPVMGLVNSHCLLEIDYPVFAQDETIEGIHFFCHFLAVLIAKETVFLQHKRYTLQKVWRKRKKRKTITAREAKNRRGFILQPKALFAAMPHRTKLFGFKIIHPWQKSRRHSFLLSQWRRLAPRHFPKIFSTRKKWYLECKKKKKRQDWKKRCVLRGLWSDSQTQINFPKKLPSRFGWQAFQEAQKLGFLKKSKSQTLKDPKRNVKASKNRILKNFDPGRSLPNNILAKKKEGLFKKRQLFRQEYQKKYFPTSASLPKTPTNIVLKVFQKRNPEQKKLHHLLCHFLWIFKMKNKFWRYKRHLPQVAKWHLTLKSKFYRRDYRWMAIHQKWSDRFQSKKLSFLKALHSQKRYFDPTLNGISAIKKTLFIFKWSQKRLHYGFYRGRLNHDWKGLRYPFVFQGKNLDRLRKMHGRRLPPRRKWFKSRQPKVRQRFYEQEKQRKRQNRFHRHHQKWHSKKTSPNRPQSNRSQIEHRRLPEAKQSRLRKRWFISRMRNGFEKKKHVSPQSKSASVLGRTSGRKRQMATTKPKLKSIVKQSTQGRTKPIARSKAKKSTKVVCSAKIKGRAQKKTTSWKNKPDVKTSKKRILKNSERNKSHSLWRKNILNSKKKDVDPWKAWLKKTVSVSAEQSRRPKVEPKLTQQMQDFSNSISNLNVFPKKNKK